MGFVSLVAETARMRCVALGSCLLLLGLLALVGAGSTLAAPAQLWTSCPTGTGAGQCSIPRGIAADPVNGHVFVADSANTNNRIVEFNALGEFIKTWGWDVVASGPGNDTTAPEDQFEVCVPRNGDVCKGGARGSGTGQFAGTQGLALDAGGNVYVVDRANFRVQKFAPDGHFLLMFGGKVNKTKVEAGGASEAEENRCPVDPGDECRIGTQGAGEGQFGAWAVGSFIAITADDKVYVGDQDRIQLFNAAGAYQSEIALPGKTVRSLDVDAAGNLYAIFNNLPDVRKITAAGTELESPRFVLRDPNGAVVNPTAVAVGAGGEVYAFGPVSFSPGGQMDPIFAFDAAGNEVDNWGVGEFTGSTGLAANLCAGSDAPGDVYAANSSSSPSFVRAYGTEPAGCFKARTLAASEIAETTATLNGTVDPDGAAVSECRFEYGPTASLGQETPCVPASPEGSDPVAVHAQISSLTKGTVYHVRLLAKVGAEAETGADLPFKTLGPPVIADEWTAAASASEALLRALIDPEGFATTYRFDYGPTSEYGQSSTETALGSDRGEHPVAVTLGGLAAGATYHWRVVAINSSGTVASPDHTVTTYRPFAAATGCANQALRSGASAALPDCRAYEMVSPVDKSGGDIVSGLDGTLPAGNVQTAPGGGRITYTSLSSFGDEPNAAAFNQYLGAREAGGWRTEGIHPPVTEQPIKGDPVSFGLTRDFIAFTPDLCEAWLIDFQEPPPSADGQLGHRNLYRRQNCAPGAGALEALIPNTTVLPEGTANQYVDNNAVQGRSEDGSHALFVAEAKLNPEAAPGGGGQVYDRFGGANHLVSVLPNGSANPSSAVVGSGPLSNLDNAVSADGARVYWTVTAGAGGAGTIYLRRHPELGTAGEDCVDPAKACTSAVSGAFAATFWGASADGAKALYTETGPSEKTALRVFSVGGPKRTIAASVEGVAGASEDLSRVYFVSREALAGAAVGGAPNLYLDDEGTKSFIGTLTEGDLGTKEPGNDLVAYDVAGADPTLRSTRVSADGGRIAFQSRAPLTDFDNTDVASGKPAVEVFSYEAGSDRPVCISCNPSGARPATRQLPLPYGNPQGKALTGVVAAAWIPGWEHSLYASKAISTDGGRIFFNSNDALLPRDANGAQDVYEWEAPGVDGCSAGDPSYFADNGGCLYLISSGESPFESIFWDASPEGSDVFFTTAASLLPQDPGLVDLYDAHVGGGFPQPSPEAPCEGEACQSPPPAPEFDTPASSAYSGPGNESALRGCGTAARRAAALSRRAKATRRKAARSHGRGASRRLHRRAGRLAVRAGKLSKNAKRCRRANRRAQR